MAGFGMALELQKLGYYNITLISDRDEWDFVLAAPFMMNKSDGVWSKKISTMLPKHKVIIGQVEAVSETVLEFKDGTTHSGWDYILIATGSRYVDLPVKDTKIPVVKGNNSRQVESSISALKNAKKVVVIGSGTVGCEYFGPLCEYHPDKKITLITSSTKVLAITIDSISKPIHDYLFAFKNGEMKFGQAVTEIENGKVKTDKGEEIEADLVYVCTGFIPNTEIFSKYLSEDIDKSGCINVTENLRLAKHPNVFVAGDIANVPEEKLAQSAGQQTAEIRENIRNILAKEGLKKYVPGKRGGTVYLGSTGSFFMNGSQVGIGRWVSLFKYYAYSFMFSIMK
jgi:NADH dehydrogenase FAD-containing subunit